VTEGKRVGLNVHVELETAAASLFVERVLGDGLAQVRTDEWQTSVAALELDDPILRVAADNREQILLERGETLVHVGLMHGHVWASVADRDAERATTTLEWLRGELPPPDPSSAHEVNVTFWTYGPHGPMPSWRSISVPGWDEIRENYSEATRAKLLPLMEGFQPARGG
jgi:hypothetical protein